MATLSEIEGIGPAYAAKLESVGIRSTGSLLRRCGGPKGREDVAAQTGISHQLILRWTNHADLFRITGIGSQYADLLEASGVDTVAELAQRKPENLHASLSATNEQKRLVRQVPALSQAARWIEEAKGLPRAVMH